MAPCKFANGSAVAVLYLSMQVRSVGRAVHWTDDTRASLLRVRR